MLKNRFVVNLVALALANVFTLLAGCGPKAVRGPVLDIPGSEMPASGPGASGGAGSAPGGTPPSFHGGSDGGGGGLLFYRSQVALGLLTQALEQVSPEDLQKNADPKLVNLYKTWRSYLIEETKKSRIRVIDQAQAIKEFELNGQYVPVNSVNESGADIKVTEKFDDKTPDVSNTNFMVIQLGDILQAVMNHIPIKDGKATHYYYVLSRLVLSAANKKPIAQTPEYRQFFHFGGEVSLRYEDLKKIKSERRNFESDFQARIDKAVSVAKLIVSRSPEFALKNADPKLMRVWSAVREQLASNLEGVKIERSLEEDKSGEEFYSKHAHFFTEGKIVLTTALKYAYVDELTFMILHEIGHSVNIEEEGMKLEEVINEMVLGIMNYAKVRLPEVRKAFEESRAEVLLNYDELMSRPEPVRVRLYEISHEGKQFLLAPPYKKNQREEKLPNGVSPEYRRTLLLCRWIGFPDYLNHDPRQLGNMKEFEAYTISESGEPVLNKFVMTEGEKVLVQRETICLTKVSNEKKGYWFHGPANAGN